MVPEYLVAVDPKNNKVQCWIPGDAGQVSSMLIGRDFRFTYGRPSWCAGGIKEAALTRVRTFYWMGLLPPDAFYLAVEWHRGKGCEAVQIPSDRSCSQRSRKQVST